MKKLLKKPPILALGVLARVGVFYCSTVIVKTGFFYRNDGKFTSN